jgi:hypothetical protein
VTDAIEPFADLPPEQRDPHWYKRAVFYEVLVRAFADSNGDGGGDLRGLIGKLDYLQWLGVDCLWLPPFFMSPLRDGGYDVSDFTEVLPEFGTIGDFSEFVDEARGSRPHAATRTGLSATSTSGRTPTSATRKPASSSWTPRRRTGRSTRCASSTSGTVSSATSRT